MSGPAAPARAEKVLKFWFGKLPAGGVAADAIQAQWWRKSDDFDDEIDERFGDLHAAAVGGGLSSWERSTRGKLALLIVLDQSSRNLHRDTPEMYEADKAARRLATALLDEPEALHALHPTEQSFVIMPLMHSEEVADHDRCLREAEALAARLEGPQATSFQGFVSAAKAHRDIVARFGRFPHRNAVVGRASTDEESDFLKEPGSSF